MKWSRPAKKTADFARPAATRCSPSNVMMKGLKGVNGVVAMMGRLFLRRPRNHIISFAVAKVVDNARSRGWPCEAEHNGMPLSMYVSDHAWVCSMANPGLNLLVGVVGMGGLSEGCVVLGAERGCGVCVCVLVCVCVCFAMVCV